MRTHLARKLAVAIDLEPVRPDQVPALGLFDSVRLGLGGLFSAMGVVWMFGMGVLAWILIGNFWAQWQGPTLVEDPDDLDRIRSGLVECRLKFDRGGKLTVIRPGGSFTLYPPVDSESPVFRVQAGAPDKITPVSDVFVGRVRRRSWLDGTWSIDNQSIDLVERFAAVGRKFPKDGVVLEPVEEFDPDKMLANPLSVMVLVAVAAYLFFVLWRIIATLRLAVDQGYQCRVMNRFEDLRSIRKIAAVTRGEPLLDEEVEQLSRMDCFRLRLGWWGGFHGMALAALAALMTLFFSVRLLTLPQTGAPRRIETPEILEQANKARVRATVSPDYKNLVFVKGRRATALDLMLIGAKDPELRGKVWIYREDGVTRGEERRPIVEKEYEVVRFDGLFDWDLPIGSVNLTGRGRHRASEKIPKSAIVIVPIESVDPGERGKWLMILGFSLAMVLFFLLTLRRAARSTATGAGRREMLNRLLGLTGLPGPMAYSPPSSGQPGNSPQA